MVRRYVYGWSLLPRQGLEVEIRVEAASAVEARRRVSLFLEDHKGVRWRLRSVTRRIDSRAEPDPPAIRLISAGRRP